MTQMTQATMQHLSHMCIINQINSTVINTLFNSLQMLKLTEHYHTIGTSIADLLLYDCHGSTWFKLSTLQLCPRKPNRLAFNAIVWASERASSPLKIASASDMQMSSEAF